MQQQFCDPKLIEFNSTEIYDFIFARIVGIDLKGNKVYEGINKFR